MCDVEKFQKILEIDNMPKELGIMEFFANEGMEQEGLELIKKIESMFE